MSGITSHVLDLAAGHPGRGIPVDLSRRTAGGAWETVGEGITDADGRTGTLLDAGAMQVATYRLRFSLEGYRAGGGGGGFYPYADVVFIVDDASRHYHIPLLLSPFGYTTYRGS